MPEADVSIDDCSTEVSVLYMHMHRLKDPTRGFDLAVMRPMVAAKL